MVDLLPSGYVPRSGALGGSVGVGIGAPSAGATDNETEAVAAAEVEGEAADEVIAHLAALALLHREKTKKPKASMRDGGGGFSARISRGSSTRRVCGWGCLSPGRARAVGRRRRLLLAAAVGDGHR